MSFDLVPQDVPAPADPVGHQLFTAVVSLLVGVGPVCPVRLLHPRHHPPLGGVQPPADGRLGPDQPGHGQGLLNWASTDSTLRRYLTASQTSGPLTTSAYDTFSDRYLSSQLQTRIVRFFHHRRDQPLSAAGQHCHLRRAERPDHRPVRGAGRRPQPLRRTSSCPPAPPAWCCGGRSAPAPARPMPAGSIWGWTPRSSPARPKTISCRTRASSTGGWGTRSGGWTAATCPCWKTAWIWSPTAPPAWPAPPPMFPASPATGAPFWAWGCPCRAGTPS